MLRPAVFRALATKRPRRVRLHAPPVDMPGNHIKLAPQAGHPETMDDIVRLQHKLDLLPRRNTNVVRRLAPLYLIPQIEHPPPPALTPKLEAHGRRRLHLRHARRPPDETKTEPKDRTRS